jgi:HCOMODA/2-hydroxy-3-carboxy-muconic semialdehyde decarboxylase
MPNAIEEARYALALANRIVAHEGVLDGFGHISIRHPGDPSRYLLSRSRSPELIEPSDILEFTLDSELLTKGDYLPYGECVIHGEIYKARPDVTAVCHHHSTAILPFCVTGVALKPMFGLGAVMGAVVPFWDSHDEFGDTPIVLTTAKQGASLAKGLGPHAMVLMRRHGATVVGATLQEAVFRSIHTHRNAELQLRAASLGQISPLSEGEAEQACAYSLRERPMGRAWEYWTTRLAKAGELPPRAKSAAPRKAGKKAAAKGAKKVAKAAKKGAKTARRSPGRSGRARRR